MKKATCLFIIACHLFLVSKGQHSSYLNANNYDSFEIRQVIKYNIDSSIKGNRQELFLKNLAKLIGLPKINQGINGRCLRIWLWQDLERKYVVNIYDKEGKKNCEVIEFSDGTDDSTSYLIVFHKWHSLQPKLGWENFLKTVLKYNIPDLQSGTIQNTRKNAATGLAYVQFEIAQSNGYKFYEYLEPSFFRYVDNSSNSVYQFLNFLNKELGIVVYNPPAPTKLFMKPK